MRIYSVVIMWSVTGENTVEEARCEASQLIISGPGTANVRRTQQRHPTAGDVTIAATFFQNPNTKNKRDF